MRVRTPIALIGIMGSGKTTTARILARRLGVTFRDLDQDIERGEGVRIADLFATRGESAFRDLEEAALGRAVGDGTGVIACGGGVVLRERSRRILQEECRTVWLEVPPDLAATRVRGAREDRPLLEGGDDRATLAGILTGREAYYSQCARYRVDSTAGPDEVAEAVLAALRSEALGW